MKQPLRILITQAQELASLGAIRSLGAAGHHVIGAYPEYVGKPAAAYSRYCYETALHPDPWAHQEAFREFIIGFVKTNNIDVVLPSCEASIHALIDSDESLPATCSILIPNQVSL